MRFLAFFNIKMTSIFYNSPIIPAYISQKLVYGTYAIRVVCSSYILYKIICCVPFVTDSLILCTLSKHAQVYVIQEMLLKLYFPISQPRENRDLNRENGSNFHGSSSFMLKFEEKRLVEEYSHFLFL